MRGLLLWLAAFVRLFIKQYLAIKCLWHDWRYRHSLKHQPETIFTQEYHAAQSGNFAVVVTYQEQDLRPDCWHLLAELKKAGFNILLMSSQPLSQATLERLSQYLWQVIIRRPFGRDFAPFQQAVLHILPQQPQRLLLLNDSVFYIQSRLATMIAQLQAAPLVGISENMEPLPHLSSFALSFGAEVLTNQHFVNFWQNYRATSSRPETIWRGEVGLSRLLFDTLKLTPHVLYNTRLLRPKLAALSLAELCTAAVNMRQHLQAEEPKALLQKIQNYLDEQIISPISQPQSPLLEGWCKSQHQRLMEAILDAIYLGSQIHRGAILFHQYLDCPVVKLDLVFRGVIPAHQATLFAEALPPAEYEQLAALLHKRGYPPQHWRSSHKRITLWWQRQLYYSGY